MEKKFLFFVATMLLSMVSVFAQYDITVSANPPHGGFVGGGGNYAYGTQVTVSAIPDSLCYEFVCWIDDDGYLVSIDPVYTFVVTQSHNLIANFVETGKTYIETKEISAIKIYPTPTSGELKVASGELKVEHIEIYDVFGKKVGITRAIVPETVIDISHLSAGVYFVKVITDAGEVVQKVVKE